MTNQSAYAVEFGFALVSFFREIEGPQPERVDDLVQVTLIVNSDDSWAVGIGRSVLLGSHIDQPVHTIMGDAATSASDLLRTMCSTIVAPHELTAGR